MHCATIAGGSGMSTYASECRLKIERRTIPGETPEQVLMELRGVIAAAGEQADVALLFDRPPLVCNRGDLVVNCVRDSVVHVAGREPRETGVAYWMDAAIFAAAGIPTVNYGPSGEGAHAAVEWVDLESVITTARVLVESARRFCSA
jgi:acetylornithine deacetylase